MLKYYTEKPENLPANYDLIYDICSMAWIVEDHLPDTSTKPVVKAKQDTCSYCHTPKKHTVGNCPNCGSPT